METTHVTYLAGGNPLGLAAADFNGDGWPDLALANSLAGASILLNDGAWGGSRPSPGVPSNPRTQPGHRRLTPGHPAKEGMVLVPGAAVVPLPRATVSIGDAGTTSVTVMAQPALAGSRIIPVHDAGVATAPCTANRSARTRTTAKSARPQVLDRVFADFVEDPFEELAATARTTPGISR